MNNLSNYQDCIQYYVLLYRVTMGSDWVVHDQENKRKMARCINIEVLQLEICQVLTHEAG